MKKVLTLTALLGALALTGCSSTPLGNFGADMQKKQVLGKTIRVPYSSVTNYFGYVKPGAPADEVKKGKKYSYIYVWIPAAAPEIGVRMASPAPEGLEPKKGDFVSANWSKKPANDNKYFDTYIEFERSLSIINPDQITNAKVSSSQWQMLGSNDDSREMPKNGGGQRYNSLIRVSTDINNPKKALVRGLYRVGFTTYKRGAVKGSFLAQIGAPVELPGVVIASSISELNAKIAANNKKK